MKKRILTAVTAAFTALLIITLNACGPAETGGKKSEYDGTTINVFNWGEYISDGLDGSLDINKEFEKRTGIHVNYTTYETNESMYAKLKAGGTSFDIIIPSDYMIARMVKEDMLQKLDFSNIPNYKNILDNYKNLYFDPKNEYSVPYNTGMVGVIYNTKYVKGTPNSWDLLWDQAYKGKILMIDNERDAFGIAHKLLGQSINTTNKADWQKAANKLKDQAKIPVGYAMDKMFDKMGSGESYVCAYYAGDYYIMADENPDLAFYYPKEGTNIFVDSVCIPKSAKNKGAAEMYINFLLEQDIATANAEYICYASPNKLVLENPDYSLKDSEYLYPKAENMPKTEWFYDLPQDILDLQGILWTEVKATN